MCNVPYFKKTIRKEKKMINDEDLLQMDGWRILDEKDTSLLRVSVQSHFRLATQVLGLVQMKAFKIAMSDMMDKIWKIKT